MPTSAARAAARPAVAFHDVLSDDGTTIRAWTNDPDERHGGRAVLLCNGLGASALHWPALLRPDCGVRVVSWHHRGVSGSERPADVAHVGVRHSVEDALSVMDAFGLDRPVVAGWSVGVTTAFELATRHPERVAGVFAVAGVPGDTFAGMLRPLHVPAVAARVITSTAARGLRLGGPLITPFTSRFPFGLRSLDVLRRTGFVGRAADPELAALALGDMLAIPVEWYMHLALTGSRSCEVDLADVAVPTTFVAGRWDLLAGSRDMAAAAREVPGARHVELRGSHFVPMEHPTRVHQLLRQLIRRVG